MKAPIDRERLLNDLVNTGVTAALVGGFALESIESPDETAGTITYAIYFLSYTAVHSCTCSALTSALLYRQANLLREDDVASWANARKVMLTLPIVKFGFGTACFSKESCATEDRADRACVGNHFGRRGVCVFGGAERTRGTRGHESHGVEDGQHAAARDILRYHLVVKGQQRVRAVVIEWRCGRYWCLFAQSPRRRVRYAFWRAALGHRLDLLGLDSPCFRFRELRPTASRSSRRTRSWRGLTV